MLKDEAVAIAKRFAIGQGLSIGEIVRVEAPNSNPLSKRWVIVLQRIDPPGMKLDPDTVIVEVDTTTGDASIEEYP